MNAHLVPTHPEPSTLAPQSLVGGQALPWADPMTPDARLLGRLATLLGLMAREAASHPELYRECPDWRTLTQLHDVLERVACTDAPLEFLRMAMQTWRRTWVERGGPAEREVCDPAALWVTFRRPDGFHQTQWRADEVVVVGDTLFAGDEVVATFDHDAGMWVEPTGETWEAFDSETIT